MITTFCNSKLGPQIGSINMPRLITCRPNCPCAKNCYAAKGRFAFKNTQSKLQQNLDFYKSNPLGFFAQIQAETSNFLPTTRLVRWHSCGDIVDMQYFEGMVKIARANKNTKYLAFTKKYELVNEFLSKHRLPKNLQIIFSSWDGLSFENPYNLPVCYVSGLSEKEDQRIPKNAVPCSGKCYECGGCWFLKRGDSVVIKKH